MGIVNRDKISTNLFRLYENQRMSSFLQRGGELYIAIEKKPVTLINELYQAGHRHFSEKYVQGAGYQFLLKKDTTDLRLNLYGHLQRNKAKKAVKRFGCVESVGSVRLASHLLSCMNNSEEGNLKEILVQVNQGKEPQKSGVLPEDAQYLIDQCIDMGLPLVGLMTIPPKGQNPIPFFKELRSLADRNNLEHCQMGMSEDWETAIRFGSTRIRLGRALFNSGF